MTFIRDRLPEPQSYFESEGLAFKGHGKWKTTACIFHGGSDSMRVQVHTGAWVCMSCGAKGGDVLAYHMQAHGLEFVEAAKALGAWQDDGKPQAPQKPMTLTPRAALEVIAAELALLLVAINGWRRGELSIEDSKSASTACARLGFITGEVLA